MKKLVTVAASLAAVAAFATEPVTSANVVGLTDQSVTGDKWYMVGVQFETVGTNAGKIAFDDLISLYGVTACGYDDQESKAAEIQYFNGASYDHFYYISDAYNASEAEVGYDCWAKDGYEVSANKKDIGEGFWFKAPCIAVSQGASMTVKGQVTTNATKSVAFSANAWQIVANPFPVAIALQDVVTTGITACGYDKQDSDAAEIQYFNGSSYDHFYYISDAYNASEAEVGFDCWAKDGYITTGTQIPAGSAFWLKSKQDGSMTFSL